VSGFASQLNRNMFLSPYRDTTFYIPNPQAPPEQDTMTKASSSSHRPQVSFSESCSVQYVECHTALTPTERNAYWYTANDIEAFHSEARSDCQILGQAAGLPTLGPSRGLELRRSSARQKRKLLTLQCVLVAAKKVQDPQRVASIYSRCNEWAAQTALVEARRDFVRAYADDKIVESLLPGLPSMTPFPLPLKGPSKPVRKRSCCSQPHNCSTERCVRRRTSCC
jgi:hypothetical protein